MCYYINPCDIIFLLVLLLLNLITTNNHEPDFVNPKNRLIMLKHEYQPKIIIGHLNINSIRFKFEFLKELIGNNIDVFLLSEAKLNDTFPSGKFLMNGYQAPFRTGMKMEVVYFYIFEITFLVKK